MAIELGRVDLCMAGGVMARFSAFPREGHMVAVLKILAYCKKHIESKLVFDPLKRDFEDVEWTSGDWSQFYPDIKQNDEPIPTNMPDQEENRSKSTCSVMRHTRLACSHAVPPQE